MRIGSAIVIVVVIVVVIVIVNVIVIVVLGCVGCCWLLLVVVVGCCCWLLLLWRWRSRMCLSTHERFRKEQYYPPINASTGGLTPGSKTPGVSAKSRETSMTKNSSSSRARKLPGWPGTNPSESCNCRNTTVFCSLDHAPDVAHQRACQQPCPRTGRPRESCNCGTSTVFCSVSPSTCRCTKTSMSTTLSPTESPPRFPQWSAARPKPPWSVVLAHHNLLHEETHKRNLLHSVHGLWHWHTTSANGHDPQLVDELQLRNIHSFLHHERLQHVGERRHPLLPFSAVSSSSSSSSSLHRRKRRSCWPSDAKPPCQQDWQGDRGTRGGPVLDPFHLLLVLRHEGEDIHQLFCHQRHKSIERGHDRRTVDELLHSAPLHPLLRPDVGETVRPRPAGLFFIEAEELRLGCGGSQIMAV